MKLRNIKSFSHNFSHSFVSCNNYVDGDFVMEDLAKFAKAAKGEVISIDWLADDVPFKGRVLKGIKYWKEWMPKLLTSHGLALEYISELRTDIQLEPSHQIKVTAYAKDINGKEYRNRISDLAIMG